MAKMNMRIEKDANEVKYVAILRNKIDKSIYEIKELLNNNDFVLSYNLLDIDELLEMRKLISLLSKAGAKIHIYEDNREVSIQFLDNLIESYLDTERYLEEVDEQMKDD
ncbi:hypothetical protein [Virgibacillus halodenitrificans]|uniref:Uncharacterized protein n=1 Tax=Virgibacillus halodenitrificans TaxID=1482 RepID=A0AAC9NKA9_VIRHA|nr:hypothetical protein [Virgibacillus halodenitrificans]APC47321.1 hypothetical protein BME96_03675 [Virgibacillus halodenitrificans]MCG1029673.1 hypothetical protein [Virgibacillus halodenitrificans]CDQ32122.1 hypothetical protein BN993_01526 [Virgibacillus halodenitrificans]